MLDICPGCGKPPIVPRLGQGVSGASNVLQLFVKQFHTTSTSIANSSFFSLKVWSST